MGKALLLTVVFVPVLLGILAARERRPQRGLLQLLVMTFAFNVAYFVLLYYLRHKWL
jgi:hypothetical protein